MRKSGETTWLPGFAGMRAGYRMQFTAEVCGRWVRQADATVMAEVQAAIRPVGGEGNGFPAVRPSRLPI